jgi:glycine reductase
VPAVAIPYPVGNPDLDFNSEKELREELVERSLNALATEIDEQTVFE